MSNSSQKSPDIVDHVWLERMPEGVVSHIIDRVSQNTLHALVTEEDFNAVKREDKGITQFYNALTLAYNEEVSMNLEFEDFLFDDESAQYVVGELGGERIQTMYDAYAEVFNLPACDIVTELTTNIKKCGKFRLLLSFCMEDTNRFHLFLKGGTETKFEILLVLYYLEHEVFDWKQRLGYMKILSDYSKRFESFFLSDAIMQSTSNTLEDYVDGLDTKGFERMLEVYNTIAEVRELFEEAEYIAEELWRQTVAGQVEFIEDIVERVAYLEDIYSFLEGNKSEDEEDIDGDNLIESHQGQVIEILQDNLAVLIKQVHRFEMGSRAHIEKIVSLWQHLVRNKRNSAMTQKILKSILETYLKLNPQDIPSFRERFSHDKQMQSFIDRLKESIQKKGTR